MKFSTSHGIGEFLGGQPTSRRCYVNCLRKNSVRNLTTKHVVYPRVEQYRPSTLDDLVEIKVDNPDRMVRIGIELTTEQNALMIAPLQSFKELFMWRPNYMLGFNSYITSFDLITNSLLYRSLRT